MQKGFSVENVGYAVRVSQELGVDIIKTFWTGSQETFAKIVAYRRSEQSGDFRRPALQNTAGML